MIKTFHSKPPSKTSDTSEKPIKKFEHIAQKQPAPQQKTTSSTPASKSRQPSVLFKNRVHAIKSDIVVMSPEWREKIHNIVANEFENLTVSKSERLFIKNKYLEIKLEDSIQQIELGNELSKRFQRIQADLSDYAKIGKVDHILDLGQVIIQIAQGIDIDIFNPNKITTKLSRFLGTKQQKAQRIKYEFDYASDQVDLKINKVYDNISTIKTFLTEFDCWHKELVGLQKDTLLTIIALKLKIADQEHHQDEEQGSIFERNGNWQYVIERWKKKVHTLNSLNQSILLTFPQINLYRTNLTTSFERLETIKINIIQVWKQQFLTVIAIDESNSTSLYYDLKEVQDTLITNIKELQ